MCIPIPTGEAWVVPRDCSQTGCASPSVDGVIKDVDEYADAYRATVQDFKSGKKSGEVKLQLDGSTLNLALTVQGGSQTCAGRNVLEVLIDSGRPATVCGGGLKRDDRLIRIEYDATTVNLLQLWGATGQWTPAPLAQQWSTKHKSTASSDGTYRIELAITLKPERVRGPSPVLEQGMFGLGLRFRTPCGQSEYLFPNRGPTFQLDQVRPETWETVTIRSPPSAKERLLSYNVGQMPFGLSDGGSGDAEDFGYVAALADHACLQETWRHTLRNEIFDWASLFASLSDSPMYALGLPNEPDAIEDEFPQTKGTPVVNVATAGGTPTWVVVGDPEIASLMGIDEEDTGLLFLSTRPILDGAVVEYSHSACDGEDCLEDKGFIWARVLTQASEPPPDTGGEIKPLPAYNGDEFLDLYCTHLQADAELTLTKLGALVRAKQLEELLDFAASTRAPDRPAVVLGDLNINGRHWPGDEYSHLLHAAGLDQLSEFDDRNTFLSDRYDFGVHTPYTTLASDLVSAEAAHGEVGKGTSLPDDCLLYSPDARLDYFLTLPAPGPLPDYGFDASGPGAVPVVYAPGQHLDPANVQSPTVPGSTCLSDHAALFAEAKIVRVHQPGTWNPASWHRLSYRIGQVKDLTGDCWLCGDADFKGYVTHSMSDQQGAVFSKQTGEFDDDSSPMMNLKVTIDSNPIFPPGTPGEMARSWGTRFELQEVDTTSPWDHYDVSDPAPTQSDPRKDAVFRFFPGTSQWVLMAGGVPYKPVGDLAFRSSIAVPTRGQNGDDRARAVHHLSAIETLGPQGPPQ